jgi:hypothetical protein
MGYPAGRELDKSHIPRSGLIKRGNHRFTNTAAAHRWFHKQLLLHIIPVNV